jgi:hypothetical protein
MSHVISSQIVVFLDGRADPVDCQADPADRDAVDEGVASFLTLYQDSGNDKNQTKQRSGEQVVQATAPAGRMGGQ